MINVEPKQGKTSKYMDRFKTLGRFKKCFNLSQLNEIDKRVLVGLIKEKDRLKLFREQEGEIQRQYSPDPFPSKNDNSLKLDNMIKRNSMFSNVY